MTHSQHAIINRGSNLLNIMRFICEIRWKLKHTPAWPRDASCHWIFR